MTHITRLEAPWFLRASKKEYKWTVRASPGPHPLGKSIPLGLLLRDYLAFTSSLKESKKIISDGKVLVDGRVRRDYKYPVGLMDVIAIPHADLYLRIVPDRARLLKPVKISEEESKFKLVRLLNKTLVKGGLLQFNLEDGRNLLISKESTEMFKLPTLTTLKISIPNQEILGVYGFKENVYVMAVGGKNAGIIGQLKRIQTSPYKTRRYSIVVIRSPDGSEYETNLENAMVIGEEKPEVKVE
ncbi:MULTISPECIES: 30S ribosomal protein S4e [Metallosphaera]|uniref:Small ribosomal subunit protein eS4 n=3 Tax=Metallosphaera TaxID=41980 RepID=RS4E_METS5|nr:MULTISPECIES: 30S ribosomal protein S4e [Metallosphaera]A4YCX8.1 RecName: Full=Small ribosomal subunit protein eS4; AltName: Full=30S ribosomal protein S4e [Metallosphaera sedula DSM 5348]ABP94280.1 SSU ribosomal protein S4E [Metallosphaera sedula DSM 5348]AIM26267.1 SSU ribosomal protein S4E [Metallosphaera sedula]AKV73282.1 30S ribosomal protein S4e [Metallosphaera sedula]AKV75526.1 30S ribosomal protein S4e [Metallosphaera sedula]AKV77772.1 30S ribosomal protein S4e [Metallosphaera sedu